MGIRKQINISGSKSNKKQNKITHEKSIESNDSSILANKRYKLSSRRNNKPANNNNESNQESLDVLLFEKNNSDFKHEKTDLGKQYSYTGPKCKFLFIIIVKFMF